MRCVLSQRRTGLGDALVSLVSAWRYARDTGRTLVIDWRGSCYLEDPRKNAFSLWFEPITELAGVPVEFAPIELPGPGWPAPGIPPPPDDEALRLAWRSKARRQAEEERLAAVAMIKSGRDVPAATVCFSGCVPVLPEPSLCRLVLEGLKPKRSILKAERRFARRNLADRPVVGVHLRHGNGGDIMGHARYWEPNQTPLERCAKTVSDARARLGGDAVVLACTDSLEALWAISQRVEDVVAYEKAFLPPGAGELHLAAQDTSGDALIEMLLLRRSTVLVRHPPGSFFSWWASLYAPEVVSPFSLDGD